MLDPHARTPWLALGLLFAACADDPAPGTSDSTAAADSGAPDGNDPGPETTPEVPLAFCQGETRFAWDPDDDTFLAAFPSDVLTRDDPSARTGLRVSLAGPDAEAAAPRWLAEEPAFFQSVWRQLEGLDGFGISAGVVLRFSAPLAAPPSGSDTAESDQVLLLDLDAGTAVPFEAEVLDDGKTFVLWPMRPLREATRHAAVITRRLLDRDGACVAPSEPLIALLSGTADAPRLTRLQPAFDTLRAALAARSLAPDDVSAATVFTTQDVSGPTLAQRAHLAAASYTWKADPTCSTRGALTTCQGDLVAHDYRVHGHLGQVSAPEYQPASYRLPVHVWLPAERASPAPLLVFGHGLGGSARQAEDLAAFAAELGLATVAISAPSHGDHPTATSTDPQTVFTSFFGIDLTTFSIDGYVFRENLRQAAFDKLQVLALLAAEPDLDGDGAADLDPTRIAYWGVSLGGILGPNFVAMSETDLAVFSIAGARLVSVVSDADDFKQMFDLLATISGGRDNLLRQAPVAQALIDGADPAFWSARMASLVADPERAAPAPHVLVQMVMNDSTVPNVATRAMARALAAPQIPTVITPVDGLAAEPAAPVSANLEGAVTAGLFQFDRYSTSPGGRARTATHAGVFNGIEAIDQVRRFLASWLDADADHLPTIVDPYAVFGTPPL